MFRRSRNALDVRLVLPRQLGFSLELWSNFALLKDASPYFTTLFESNFAETLTTSSSKRRCIDESTPQASASKGKEKKSSSVSGEPREFDDSDDEADEAAASHFPKGADDDSAALYHEVILPQACYTTFEAVLSYITTGYIEFAPLATTLTAEQRSTLRAQHLASTPLLPLPTSPKSVYSLAHLLDLPKLAALALNELEQQLTPNSVADVLFSDVALVYDDIKEMAFKCAVEHWSDVQASAGMQEVQKQVEADQAPEFGKLAFELLMRVGKKKSKSAGSGLPQIHRK